MGEHKERVIYEAAQNGLDSNDNRTNVEKEPHHELAKEEKGEEGVDQVDGEMERGRRPSLLEQMIVRSFNIADPQHPSNNKKTNAEREPQELAKEEKEEEGDDAVDGEMERGRRPSLLEQMIVRSFNIADPQHP